MTSETILLSKELRKGTFDGNNNNEAASEPSGL
jgi:hypothetical protein